MVEPNTLNPYPYVLNNPLKYVDPLGLFLNVPTMMSDGGGSSKSIPSPIVNTEPKKDVVKEVKKEVVKKETSGESDWSCMVANDGLWSGDDKILSDYDYLKINALKYIYNSTNEIDIKDAAHKEVEIIRLSYGYRYVDNYNYSTSESDLSKIRFNFNKISQLEGDWLTGIVIDAGMEASGDMLSDVVNLILNVIFSGLETIPAREGDLEVSITKNFGCEYYITDFYFRKDTYEMYYEKIWPKVDIHGGSLAR